MNDAPERIWASKSTKGECVVSFSTPSEEYAIEYARADLLDAMTAERDAALARVAAIAKLVSDYSVVYDALKNPQPSIMDDIRDALATDAQENTP